MLRFGNLAQTGWFINYIESFDVNNCNELNILFGEIQFSVSQVLKRSATMAISASGKPQMETENIINVENSRKKTKGNKTKDIYI
jgi:hypothetical protein